MNDDIDPDPDSAVIKLIAATVQLTDATWGQWLARLTNPLDRDGRDELWQQLAWEIGRDDLEPAYKLAVIADLQSEATHELNLVMGSAASLAMSLHLEAQESVR